MMGMIMVDSVGSGKYVIWPLRESDWNGLSTADCVFPSFLFIMGLAIPLAVKADSGKDLKVWGRVLKRFVLLFVIGLILNL
jgi:predicted acyltransferase